MKWKNGQGQLHLMDIESWCFESWTKQQPTSLWEAETPVSQELSFLLKE